MRKCPHLIFVPPRFEAYKEVSDVVMSILTEYTDLVEPLSLDEAFIDVTNNSLNLPAIKIAAEIRERILETTGLTASAGVSINKFLAKIASDYRKPNGLFVVLPKDAERFVEELEIERFYCVGKVTARKMHSIGVHTGADLKKFSETDLVRIFGKMGHLFYENAHAIDSREVVPHRIRKSVGAENTFETDLAQSTRMTVELYHIARRVWSRITEEKFYGRTLTLKIKYADFEILTRSKTFPYAFRDFGIFWKEAQEILKVIDTDRKKVRLMGLCISHDGETAASVKNECIQLEIIFKEW